MSAEDRHIPESRDTSLLVPEEMSLAECRLEIDLVDEEIAGLLDRRMRVAKQAGTLKLEDGLPVLDLERERQVRDHVMELSRDTALGPFRTWRVFKHIVETARELQVRDRPAEPGNPARLLTADELGVRNPPRGW